MLAIPPANDYSTNGRNYLWPLKSLPQKFALIQQKEKCGIRFKVGIKHSTDLPIELIVLDVGLQYDVTVDRGITIFYYSSGFQTYLFKPQIFIMTEPCGTHDWLRSKSFSRAHSVCLQYCFQLPLQSFC